MPITALHIGIPLQSRKSFTCKHCQYVHLSLGLYVSLYQSNLTCLALSWQVSAVQRTSQAADTLIRPKETVKQWLTNACQR